MRVPKRELRVLPQLLPQEPLHCCVVRSLGHEAVEHGQGDAVAALQRHRLDGVAG
jgi:hypothetical protein